MIDLHWTLFGARSEPAVVWRELWAQRTEITLVGRPTSVPGRPGQAMQLAMHAAQHGPNFTKPLEELSLALTRWPRHVWESAAALAHRIGALEAFAAGLRLVPSGAVVASDLALLPTPELEWEIRHGADRPRGTFHLRALAEAGSLGERMRVVRRSLLPGRTWIRHEYPWARRGPVPLAAAYGLHLVRAPLWVMRAWAFSRRARQAARRSG
jgi:hypothetical protein